MNIREQIMEEYRARRLGNKSILQYEKNNLIPKELWKN